MRTLSQEEFVEEYFETIKNDFNKLSAKEKKIFKQNITNIQIVRDFVKNGIFSLALTIAVNGTAVYLSDKRMIVEKLSKRISEYFSKIELA